MIKSKLNIVGGTGLIILLIPFGTFLLIGAIYSLFDDPTSKQQLTDVWIMFWMCIVVPLLWIIEVPKIVIIETSVDYIRITNPLTRKTKIIMWDSLDGFKRQVQSSRGGSYEIIYLVQGGVKIQELSSFHIRNFSAIKQELADNLEDLGFEKFELLKYLKERLKGHRSTT